MSLKCLPMPAYSGYCIYVGVYARQVTLSDDVPSNCINFIDYPPLMHAQY